GVFNQGRAFTEHALPVVRVVSLGVFLMATASVWLFAVVGTGHSRVNFYIELGGSLTYLVLALIMIEWMQVPLHVAWMIDAIYWVVMFIPAFLFIRSGRWKKPAAS